MAWLGAFQDRTVVVTGASSGIGRATAVAFGAAGARVALVARRRPELEAVAAEIGVAGAHALVVPTDVTSREAVSRAFDAVRDGLGDIDVVVNNAGVLIPSTVRELSGRDLEAMLRV